MQQRLYERPAFDQKLLARYRGRMQRDPSLEFKQIEFIIRSDG